MTIRLPVICTVIALLTGCGGPVETRSETHSIAALPAQKIYALPEKPAQSNGAYKGAQELVVDGLAERGFSVSDTAPLLLQIALAERPADMSMMLGENESQRAIATAKLQKPLQSCNDREHRLTLTILDVASGAIAYRGTAAEYHCKGVIADSLPHLVEAALADLGAEPSDAPRTNSVVRSGIE